MSRQYQICIAHFLDESWNEWFDGVTLTPMEDGTTLLTTTLDDPTTLHTVLSKIINLNFDLISVSFTESLENCDETS